MGIKFEKVFFLVIVLVATQLFISLADDSLFDGRITFPGASVNEGLVEQEGKADQWYLSHARKLREHFRFLKGGRGGGGSFSGGTSMKMSGSGGGGGGGGARGKQSAAFKAEVPTLTLFLPCMSLVVLTLIRLI
ncbi:hypothetical protein RHGRI_021347 [Rhododendron griersonianum]|uniref:Glycine-rich protein n=1 Tax=Rhododendron griersonianum TaxID=479676 RepID=A0AAV6JLS9_9ERIC|nr:hypothetical protein RHGRI_021347 [Rhododendron griersonianum]